MNMAKGFSKSRLARMQDVLAGHVDRGEVPGLVALVSRRGETHAMVMGRTGPNGAPLTRDSLFRISSMTKPITAAAAMLLVEECRLRLDVPVDRLLPELANRKVLEHPDAPLDRTVPARRAITVRDLLTFRLGFGQMFEPHPIQRAASELNIGMGPPQPQSLPAPDAWMRNLGSLPLVHQPGEAWMYNTGADILGVLIARASGQPFDVFLRERLFEPLGMKDTGFSVPAASLSRLPPSLWTNPRTGATDVYDPVEGQWSKPPAFPSGGGGLVSTADDYFAFAELLLNLGRHRGQRLLSRPSVELMSTDQLTSAQKGRAGFWSSFFESNGWGFGMSVVTRREGLQNVGSYGWSGGMGTTWASDPREDLIGILMTQRMWSSPSPPPVCQDFWTLAYQAIED